MQPYIQFIAAAGFDWDNGNRLKCQKHGLSLAEIETVFADTVQVAPDTAHSQGEIRQLAIGRTSTGRFAFVVFTLREIDNLTPIRPLSARFMHAKEIKRYDR